MKNCFFIAVLFFLSPFSIFAQTDPGTVIDVTNTPQNEDNPSVAISRTNRNNIVIGASTDDMDSLGIPAFFSTDRGKTWNTSRLPMPANPDFYIYGEPSLASDEAGNFYYAYITNDGADSAGNISIAHSTDGGMNWKNVLPINIDIQHYGYPDGAFISVDNSPTSPHKGRVYVTWDQFYASIDTQIFSGGLYVTWSDNQGKNWNIPKLLTNHCDDYQEVRTGKNGEVYISSSDSLFEHELFVSVKGDTVFTLDPGNPISDFQHYPFFYAGPDVGETGLKGALGFPAAPYVSFDVDISTNRIHAVYGDYLDGIATLYYSYSDDNGVVWSPAQEISELSSEDRFFQWVSVDQNTHDPYVLFLSSESDAKNNILVAPYRLLIGDSSDKILSAPFNPLIVEQSSTTAPYIGDHTSSDAFDSVYAATWTQNRTGYTDGDVFAFIQTGNAEGKKSVPLVIHSQKSWLSAPYPNPSDGKNISISYYLPHETRVSFGLYDIAGKLIKQISDKTEGEGTHTEQFLPGTIPAGTYIIRMITGEGELGQKIVVE